jgi:hypothetical protein
MKTPAAEKPTLPEQPDFNRYLGVYLHRIEQLTPEQRELNLLLGALVTSWPHKFREAAQAELVNRGYANEMF